MKSTTLLNRILLGLFGFISALLLTLQLMRSENIFLLLENRRALILNYLIFLTLVGTNSIIIGLPK